MDTNKLIFDIGMHLGQDTEYYLQLGYCVVAVDASPIMIEKASERFRTHIETGRLVLLNYAMFESDHATIDFHISEKTEWNSINKNISTRQNQKAEAIRVSTAKLSTLFKEYGIPLYCKIDVEGFDDTCIQTLKELDTVPRFISCETECFSENQTVTEEEILATLVSLQSVGYTKFKLIEQDDLTPLRLGKSFYKERYALPFAIKALQKLLQPFRYKVTRISNREQVSWGQKFDFLYGSTGPFGNELQGEWMNFETARKTLLFHRKDFFSLKHDHPVYTIWCDWHATF